MDTNTAISILKYVIFAFALYQSYLLGQSIFEKRHSIATLAKSTVDASLGKSTTAYFSEDHFKSMMSKYGLMYSLHDYNMETSTLLLIKTLSGVLSGFVVASLSDAFLIQVLLFLAFLVAGFFLPDLLMKEMNKSDNEKMLDDIICIYSTLKIYTTSSQHMTDALIKCQRLVENGRLKEALLELNNNILSGKITTEDSIDLFNSRFCNNNIDNLCIIIKQALRTGHSAEILSDISKQIEGSISIRTLKRKEMAKRKMTMIQVIFFVSIGAIALYIVGAEMANSMSSI